VNLRRLIFSLYLALFAGVSVTAGLYFYNTRKEYNTLKGIELKNQLLLEEAERRVAEQQQILERLRTDPDYVEKVIRKKLGYTKEGETIFRFDN
jgi:cell division protein FtsB